ncbi:MAG: MFS transporter [Negativicutes bacterium]|nr:MFS transporter [Negativicutes bacterium]
MMLSGGSELSYEWQQRLHRLNRRRWAIWWSVALALLTAYFHRTVTGVIADSLMRDFSIARASDLGVLASIYFYIYAAMQIPAGILADAWGPRRTIGLALAVAALGAAVFGAAPSLPWVYAGRVLATLGVSVIFVSLVKLQVEWFRLREFCTVSGLIVVVANSGSLLSATPLAFAVETVGWRASFYIIAAFTLFMAAVCWLVVRDRPAAIGLPPIADFEAREGLPSAPDTGRSMSACESLGIVLGNTRTWWPFLSGVMVYGVYMSFMGIWGVPYFMQVYGMSRVEAANYVIAMAVGNMIGGQAIGYLSDRVGRRSRPYTLIATCFFGVWLILTVWNGGKPPVWALYPLCLGIGIGTSGVTLGVACTKEVNPPQAAGIAAGVANSGPFVGAALMQPLFGWVLDLNWQGVIEHGVKVYPPEAYQYAFWLCAAVLAAGIGCTLMIKETYCTNIGVRDSSPANRVADDATGG